MHAKLMYSNQGGGDDCYAELDVQDQTHKQITEQLCNSVDFCNGVLFEEFEEEFSDENGTVYGFDGIGIYIAKEEKVWDALYLAWEKDFLGA